MCVPIGGNKCDQNCTARLSGCSTCYPPVKPGLSWVSKALIIAQENLDHLFRCRDRDLDLLLGFLTFQFRHSSWCFWKMMASWDPSQPKFSHPTEIIILILCSGSRAPLRRLHKLNKWCMTSPFSLSLFPFGNSLWLSQHVCNSVTFRSCLVPCVVSMLLY